MTLGGLRRQADYARAVAAKWCLDNGKTQSVTDILGTGPSKSKHHSLLVFSKSNVLQWARNYHLNNSPPSNLLDLTDMATVISRAGDATDLYLYAHQHGTEAAMLWKLGKP